MTTSLKRIQPFKGREFMDQTRAGSSPAGQAALKAQRNPLFNADRMRDACLASSRRAGHASRQLGLGARFGEVGAGSYARSAPLADVATAFSLHRGDRRAVRSCKSALGARRLQ